MLQPEESRIAVMRWYLLGGGLGVLVESEIVLPTKVLFLWYARSLCAPATPAAALKLRSET